MYKYMCMHANICICRMQVGRPHQWACCCTARAPPVQSSQRSPWGYSLTHTHTHICILILVYALIIYIYILLYCVVILINTKNVTRVDMHINMRINICKYMCEYMCEYTYIFIWMCMLNTAELVVIEEQLLEVREMTHTHRNRSYSSYQSPFPLAEKRVEVCTW